MPEETIKKIKMYAIGLASSLGAIYGGLQAYQGIKQSMDETAKKKIEEYTLPVVRMEINQAIKKTVDSIFSARQVSFRETLAEKLEVDKAQVADLIADWYWSEQSYRVLGLYWDYENEEVKYLHTDLRTYRALKDSLGNYYFINRQGRAEWCK